jgi:hypothetical protein
MMRVDRWDDAGKVDRWDDESGQSWDDEGGPMG